LSTAAHPLNRESRSRPRRTSQRRDISPTAIVRSSSSSKSSRVTAFPAAIKGPRRVPCLTPHRYSRTPLLPRHPSAAAPSTTTSSPPPPEDPPLHASQPKVGRGIDSPCSPLRFTLLPDCRRGPARRQSPSAGRPRAASLPPSVLNRGGGRRWLFGRKPPSLFPFFHPTPYSLFPSHYSSK
jgi:hypothetical protein